MNSGVYSDTVHRAGIPPQIYPAVIRLFNFLKLICWTRLNHTQISGAIVQIWHNTYTMGVTRMTTPRSRRHLALSSALQLQKTAKKNYQKNSSSHSHLHFLRDSSDPSRTGSLLSRAYRARPVLPSRPQHTSRKFYHASFTRTCTAGFVHCQLPTCNGSHNDSSSSRTDPNSSLASINTS